MRSYLRFLLKTAEAHNTQTIFMIDILCASSKCTYFIIELPKGYEKTSSCTRT